MTESKNPLLGTVDRALMRPIRGSLFSLLLFIAWGILAPCNGSLIEESYRWRNPLSTQGDKVAFEDLKLEPFHGSAGHSLADIGLLRLHEILVSIPSVTGDENAIAMFLKNLLSHDFQVELQHVPDLENVSDAPSPQRHQKRPRFNVFAHPHGHRRTPLLLTSHIDTVPPYLPYSLRENDEIWGRGSVDAKGCVAAQLQAYQQLVDSGQINSEAVSFLFVVGEERTGDGMQTANQLGLSWDTVIFGEPTELKLASGHKGLLIVKIKAHGKAAHSGYPELGESAIDMILPALNKLKNAELPWSSKFGNTTVNIGRLTGGVAANVIAKEAEADIGIRIAAGSSAAVQGRVLDIVRQVDQRLEVEFVGGTYGPVNIDHDVPGFDTVTVNYGTDIPNLDGDHKRYLYGGGSILVAHSDDEHLRIQDLRRAVEGYQRLILHALEG